MSNNRSSGSDGKDFERRVHQLLSLRGGVQNLVREKQFASKKVDIYFELKTFGARKRYGVECKDYSKTLNQGDVSAINATYAGLFSEREITDLLIVSRARLGPSAQSYIDSIPTLSHMTLDELRNSLIDFRGYLSALKTRFSSEPVFRYFVEPRGTIIRDENESGPAQEAQDPYLLTATIQELSQPRIPLVVLGAYGIGKTTFAKALFLRLLEMWERDSSLPLPIYISLDRMMQEQSLEGLLGTIFASVSPCEGYNFDLFCSLNAMDHFILILDGIDEMRQKLSWEEFKYNLDQLSILTSENPRSVLLGRQTAFMDQREYDAVVHGKSFQGRPFQIPSRVSYRETFIDTFTDNQIESFIERFCAWRYLSQPSMAQRAKTLLLDRQNSQIEDIAKRPVQLMMLLEILPQLPQRLDRITHTTVYSAFIDELIGREKSKHARRAFSARDHRKFAQRVAVWLWHRGRSKSVEASQIGRELLEDFAKPNDEIDEVRRALVAASFLSTEGGRRLHFPHNSIQEFLIAEFIADSLLSPGQLATAIEKFEIELDEVLSLEIAEFLFAQVSHAQLAELFDVASQRRLLPRAFEGLLWRSSERSFLIQQLDLGSPVCAWLMTIEALHWTEPDRRVRGARLVDQLSGVFRKIAENRERRFKTLRRSQRLSAIGTHMLCMLVLIGKFQLDSSPLISAICELLVFGDEKSVERLSTQRGKRIRERTFVRDPQINDFLDKIAANVSGDNLNVDWVYKYARVHLSAPIPLNMAHGESIAIPNVELPMKVSIEKSPLSSIRDELRHGR